MEKRPQLDSDVQEKLEKLSHESGVSVTALVNIILRNTEIAFQLRQEKPEVQTHYGRLRFRPSTWKPLP